MRRVKVLGGDCAAQKMMTPGDSASATAKTVRKILAP